MKILLTAWALVAYSGIPLFTRDLASALKRAGADVAVYTLRPGAISDAIAADGIPVVTDLQRLPFTPDIIHGQDQPLLIQALRHYPHAAAVSVTHDATSIIDAPFCHPRINRYVAVDERCRARIAAIPDIAPGKISVQPNAVDLERFRPRSALPQKPERALIFSNYAMANSHMPAVLQACAMVGLAVDVVGSGVGKAVPNPETVLGQYDLVFAKARCALEALATGTATVLCDTVGLGPMVTSQNVAALRRMNFGAGVLTQKLAPEMIAHEITKYDAADATRVAQTIRAEAGLDASAAAWLTLYRQAIEDALQTQRAPGTDAALAAAARHWRNFYRAMPLVSGVMQVKRLPVVGVTLYSIAARLWHMRY